MEGIGGEELSRQNAEIASLRQLLASKDAQLAQSSVVIAVKDELLATKDELLASRIAELKRCEALLQCRNTTSESHIAAAGSSKRQRPHDSCMCPLDRNDILSCVFSFVGGGDHLYTGGVSKRWRSIYLKFCAQSKSKRRKQFVTRRRNVLMTDSRLRLALSCGLAVTDWKFDSWLHAEMLCRHSLEPEKVTTLLRVHGVAWGYSLCHVAAYNNKLSLLQWLHAHTCPWNIDIVLNCASSRGSVAMLDWLLTVIPFWTSNMKQDMFTVAASDSSLDAMQWLRDHGAVWPTSFSDDIGLTDSKVQMCWSVSAVQWALAHGSGWLDWKCEDYAADKYERARQK
eukprot:11084-Heterococcus_DN1.PRE.3